MHDRGASATEVFCRDRDFSVVTDLYKSQKKIPWKIRASQLGIRAKVYELPGTQCLVQASQLGVKT